MKEQTRIWSEVFYKNVTNSYFEIKSFNCYLYWRRKWQPTPVFLPGESQGWRSLWLPSMGSHRVRHDWSDLAAAAATTTVGRQDCFKSNLVVKEICLQAAFKNQYRWLKDWAFMILGCPRAATEPTAISTFLFQNRRLKKKNNNGPIDFNGIVLYLGWLTVSWFFRSSIIIRVLSAQSTWNKWIFKILEKC